MTAGVYVHIPFCRSRCSYCDFATDIYRDAAAVDRYVSALTIEIHNFELPRDPIGAAGGSDRAVNTVYFGGGTPSLLKANEVERILLAIQKNFSIACGAEITMEMNPATVTPESLREYRALGVNRASFGVQTFNDHALKLLARGHDANDARQTYRMLRDAGFENISFDLIAGLPHQSLEDWERNLDEAISMQPEHLSLYLLDIHEGTPLAEQVRSGRQPRPDDDIAAAMYQKMRERLIEAGYFQYEISNFAKPGFESRHNTKYWRLEPVYGFGVSAHSFDGRERYSNVRDTGTYVERMFSKGSAEASRLVIDEMSEYIFLGLRMNRGIDPDDFYQRFHQALGVKYGHEIEELEDLKLVEMLQGGLRLTPTGMLYSNEVFTRFI